MNQMIKAPTSRLRAYGLPIASLLLNWWAASLFTITLISGCLGTFYGLFHEPHTVWFSLLCAVLGGALIHSMMIVIALTISIVAEPACELEQHETQS